MFYSIECYSTITEKYEKFIFWGAKPPVPIEVYKLTFGIPIDVVQVVDYSSKHHIDFFLSRNEWLHLASEQGRLKLNRFINVC